MKINNRQLMGRITGFTLIETIIAIDIAALLLLVVTSTYIVSQNTYSHIDTKAELSQNGRVILDRIIREIRQAPDIVTDLPTSNSDPDSLPEEIMFQDGHDTSVTKYIRYYLDGTDVKRQLIAYYFSTDPGNYVYYQATDQNGNSPEISILEDRVIGEYAYDLEFWGEKLININLYLLKNGQQETIFTSVYGRNL